jgi:SulP family sulfate permease
VAAGLLVATVAVTFCVAYGLIAFHPLGPVYGAFGVQAGLWGGVATALVAALVGGTHARATAPIVAGALLLAELLQALGSDPRLPADPSERFATATALAALAVAAAGIFQVAFGALRLGGLLKYLAYPVVAGLMAAVALLVVKSQIPIILGWTGWSAWRAQTVSLPTLLTGAVVILAVVFGPRWLWGLPGQVIGLAVGLVLGTALSWGAGAVIGRVDPLPSSLPAVIDAASALRLIGEHGFAFAADYLLVPGLSIALFSSLSSLLASAAVDAVSGEAHDSNRELIGQGLGNAASGLVGGLAGGGAASLSTMNYRCGGRTRLAGVAAAVMLACFILFFDHVITVVPKAVVAAIVVVGAIRLIDPWVLRLCRAAVAPGRRADRATVVTNLGLLVGVAATGFVFDLIVAIVVGLLASSAHFIARAARVRFRLAYRGHQVHSKRARPLEDQETLVTLGRRIAVFELQGTVFFGSAERLVARMKREASDASYIVVGLGRVDEIDASGFRVLYQFLSRMRREGRFVLIAHLTTRHPLWPVLADMGVDPHAISQQGFADTDSALEWAEDRLLETHGRGRRARTEVTLGQIDVLRDAPPEMLEWFARHLPRQIYAAGSVIIREGDTDRSLYMLTAGVVSVRVTAADGDRQRLVSFAAGTIFGELAFLDAGLRSASLVADEESCCYVLTVETFERLQRERPDLAVKLLANISIDLVQRLRAASSQIRALQS